jgi:hypothetical protein
VIASEAICLFDHSGVDDLLSRVGLVRDPLSVKAKEARKGDRADALIACEPL